MIEMIAYAFHLVHNRGVAETTAARGESRNLQAGRTANIGGIFTSHAMKPSMGGMVGSRKARRVPVADLSTHHRRPPSFESDVSGQPLLQEATDMATTHSAPAHTSPIENARTAGAQAARAWYSNPKVSLARARDFALSQYVASINFSAANLPELAAFEQGFSGGLVEAVFGGAK